MLPNLAVGKITEGVLLHFCPLITKALGCNVGVTTTPGCLNTPAGSPYCVTAGGNEMGAEALGCLQHSCPVPGQMTALLSLFHAWTQVPRGHRTPVATVPRVRGSSQVEQSSFTIS